MSKKRHFLLFAWMPLILVACIGFHILTRAARSTTPAETEHVRPVVVLDAGHGGEDGGASGDGLIEKDLNLIVTEMLRDYLQGAGYTVVMTREDDRLLCEPETPKGHRKQRDLKNRLEIAKQYPGALLVSIHMNSYPGAPCSGLQVWYSENHAASREIAASVQNNVKALLQPENHRKIKVATSAIYLLRHSESPAILVECGFLSNPAECTRLSDEMYLRGMALAIFEGITEKMPE